MKKFSEKYIIELFTKNQKFLFQNDDCEVLPSPRKKTAIITADSLIEHTHFCLEWYNPHQLARKLFQVNLSDMISSGGIPEWCILQIGIPHKIGKKFIETFAEAFLKECNSFQCSLIGGDTFYSEILVLSLTLGGSTDTYISRKSQPNSFIYVTGQLGLSQLGLDILLKKMEIPAYLKAIALKKHLEPEARIEWAQKLYPHVISMMDISDGIVQDSMKMAQISGYQFEIELDKIPLPSDFTKYIHPLSAAASGEEYELLFTSFEELNFPFVKKIGKVKNKKLSYKTPAVVFKFNNKKINPPQGFVHF